MSKCIKVRMGRSSNELHEFDTRDEAFTWIRNNTRRRTVFSVLTYERGELSDMTRWYYDGQYFKRENITS